MRLASRFGFGHASDGHPGLGCCPEDVSGLGVANSGLLLQAFMARGNQHEPLWLVGYNNFELDNVCLATHSDSLTGPFFRQISLEGVTHSS